MGEPTGRGRLPADHEDADLVHNLIEGDQLAFREVYREWFPSMLRLASSYVSSRAVAEEVVHDTWVHFMVRLGTFEGRSRLKTWTFRMLLYNSINRSRRERRERAFNRRCNPSGRERQIRDGPQASWPGTATIHPDQSHLVRANPSPEQDTLTEELGRQLTEAIKSLPHRQKSVLVLHDVRGWKPLEICEALKISYANQRTLLHRARMRVREALSPYLEARR